MDQTFCRCTSSEVAPRKNILIKKKGEVADSPSSIVSIIIIYFEGSLIFYK